MAKRTERRARATYTEKTMAVERKSLADEAVEALASINRMDFNITNEHEERHYVRSLKRLAEQALTDACRQVREMAWLAEDMRKTAQTIRDAEAPAPVSQEKP
jgi:hypothetical protein